MRSGIFIVALATMSIISSCKKDESGTFYGPSVTLGNGTAKAYITLDENGDPTAVGVNLSETALAGLPMAMQGFVLSFPADKGPGFYTHAMLDWNPMGHEPAGVYDQPHFDIHFYYIPNEERLTIEGLNPPENDTPPAANYLPPMYMQIPGMVPAMGAHWADLQAPEFNGQPFSKTFIWGSYHGKFVFQEPMVTLAYLQTHPDATTALRQPTAFQEDGWYPMNYKVSYSASSKDFVIAITELMFKTGQ